MSDRLQRISDNAGRVFAALLGSANTDVEKLAKAEERAITAAVATAIRIEQEVAKQTLAAFAPKQPCSCGKEPHDRFCFEVTRPGVPR